jgi:PAS domain S-box-containing protein
MKIRSDYKIVALAVLGSFLLWIIDACIDTLVFHEASFSQSLFDFSPHELYFRFFVTLSLVIFGLAIIRIRKRHWQIEKRYKNLVELATDIIYVLDKDGNQVFMNDAAYNILEYSPEEVIGKPWPQLIHPEDRLAMTEKIGKMVEQGIDVFNFENRYITKSGNSISVIHNIRLLRNGKGEFAGVQGIARDITKRKEAEEELKKAMVKIEDEKVRSESIVSAIGDGISILDKDFRVLYQNHAQKIMTGGDRTGEICYVAYAQGGHVCPGCPVAETFRDGGIHMVEKTTNRNEEVRTLEIKASPLRDSTGRIVAGIEAVRDITERKRAEEQLKLFSEVIDEAMDGIQVVDLDGRVVYSNKAVEEIYGFSPSELEGRNVNDMNADREFADRVIIPQLKMSGRWNGELLVVHKDGRTFPVWISASMVKNEQGKPIAMVGIIRDITERKQAEGVLIRHHEQLMKLVEERTQELTQANEKLRKEIEDRERMEEELVKVQKLESLGILAGGIAHDFNNLLASILGNISLAMLDLQPSDGPYRQLEAAERASLRAQGLTRQLLTFSKGGEPVKRTTSITELIKESAGFALRGSRVRHDFFFADGLWLLDVDEGQISQVIHNLVINADHAMPEGGTISVHCENCVIGNSTGLPLRPGYYVKVSVKDHGVGIVREHLSKIFDPYFTTKQKGSGLGLATSYSIIKKHGGHIVAESELGVGTTFTFYLPASRSGKVPKQTEETKLFTGTGKILLMDDEEDVRQTTGDVLKRLGYQVQFAADGERAIELYQQARTAGQPFDAVIMDLTVPGGMGGRDALIKILAIDPEVKAIVSSGYSNDPIMADYQKYGFRGVVTKPYRIKDLGETLHNVLLNGAYKPTGADKERTGS